MLNTPRPYRWRPPIAVTLLIGAALIYLIVFLIRLMKDSENTASLPGWLAGWLGIGVLATVCFFSWVWLLIPAYWKWRDPTGKRRHQNRTRIPRPFYDEKSLQGLRELLGMPTDPPRTFVLALRHRPLVGVLETAPATPLKWGGHTYHKLPWGQFTGHYDWLISGQGELLGVAYHTFRELDEFEKDAAALPYTSRHETILHIWFCDAAHRDPNPPHKVSQDLGNNHVFQDESGEWLVTFHASFMKPGYEKNLWLAEVDWEGPAFLPSRPK